MKSIRHKAVTAAAVAVLALGGALAATVPASAATAGAYNGACGKGYEVFTSTPVNSSQTTVAATTYVAYSSADKQWCAVTVRNKPGARVFMEVTLDTWPTSSTLERDAGSYTTFAGPVYKDLPAPGLCMTWSGSIDVYYNSDRGLCP
ncbi:hypothetical protein [Streptomyces sp. SAS_272]|uniref:hypothetical protein n=1 Tax=Streptomyces sp. SAS_272 TaxID=3412747 RepID=UPI00403CCD73